MGRAPREKPARLAAKLAQIRNALNLSQDDMIRRLGLEHQLTREEVSKYERGLRVPSLPALLKYARAAGLAVDDLIDDDSDLPEKLPTSSKSAGSKQRKSLHGKSNRSVMDHPSARRGSGGRK
jgi:transcriptional regulator with XRE-family HTH domain